MPFRWRDWVHITTSTRGQWLPGDPRGFRDHDHRIHSSGDYKNPPPSGEYAGLHRHALSIAEPPVWLTRPQQRTVGEAIVEKFADMRIALRILAVGPGHVHGLIRAGESDARKLLGRAKQLASFRVRDELPGTIWGEGSHPVRIRDSAHYRTTVGYIARHAREGAWVWNNPNARS